MNQQDKVSIKTLVPNTKIITIHTHYAFTNKLVQNVFIDYVVLLFCPLQYGWTPLHWASWNGHLNTICTLVNNSRINVSITDKSGSNALHCASLNGHSAMIKTLVSAKADINLQRMDGWTPLHLASWNGHTETVCELLASHCKVNMRTDSGMGPLHLAAAKGCDEIVQELLEAGVAPDMQDKVN